CPRAALPIVRLPRMPRHLPSPLVYLSARCVRPNEHSVVGKMRSGRGEMAQCSTRLQLGGGGWRLRERAGAVRAAEPPLPATGAVAELQADFRACACYRSG